MPNFLEQIGYLTSTNRRSCRIKSGFQPKVELQAAQEPILETVKVPEQKRRVRKICENPSWVKFLKNDEKPPSSPKQKNLQRNRKVSRDRKALDSRKQSLQRERKPAENKGASLKAANGIRFEPLTPSQVQEIRLMYSKGDKMEGDCQPIHSQSEETTRPKLVAEKSNTVEQKQDSTGTLIKQIPQEAQDLWMKYKRQK